MKTEFDLSTASMGFGDRAKMPETATIPQIKKFKEMLEAVDISDIFEQCFEVPFEEAKEGDTIEESENA